MKKLFFACNLLLLSAFPLVSEADAENKEEVVQQKIESSSPEEAAKTIIGTNDKDKDGMLSKDEVDLRFKLTRFDDVDTNKDSKLSLEELTKSYENARAAQATSQKTTEQRRESLWKRINPFG